MKKRIVTLLAVISMAICGSFDANAQHFLVKAGMSYTNLDLNDDLGAIIDNFDVKSYAGYHFGIGIQTGTIMGFSLQPELLYNVKGTQIGDNIDWTMGYLEVPVNIQWGPDLVLCRPYIMFSPYAGYCIANKVKFSGSGSGISTDIENITEDAKRLEYGLGLGAGIEIWKLQVSGKYCWNFGHVASFKDYVEDVSNISRGTAGGLEVSVAILF